MINGLYVANLGADNATGQSEVCVCGGGGGTELESTGSSITAIVTTAAGTVHAQSHVNKW